jgi:long-chain acyl-CoA synthetase
MDVTTLGGALRRSCRTWPNKVAMLYPDGKEFASITYEQLEHRVRGYCQALLDWGVKRGDRVALQSENCVEWALIDWACRCLGVVLVPIYPTLPADQTEYIVRDAQCFGVISSTPEQQEKVASIDLPKRLIAELANDAAHTEMPVDQWEQEVDAADPEDVTTFIYTSGTTGNPKGAMLPHRAILHVCKFVDDYLPLNHDDTFLTFLPMSHVYERVAGQALPVFMGATIAYSKGLASLGNELKVIKPTILLCVPRFLEATMDKILDGVRKKKPIEQRLFFWALDQGAKRAEGKFAPFAGLLDKLVGEKIRAHTGGRIRFFVSGGAALPPHVARFYMAFRLTVLQGWGLTETSAGTTLNWPERNKYWTVGEPLGMELKIAEDGEILTRGPGLMLGYWNLPEETAQAIDAEGWFHTGDIGEFEGASLKITDRKKDLLVLANGKNVAPQKIENLLKESHLIQEAVLFGDGNEYVYGLILPNLERLRAHLRDTTSTDEALVASEAARSAIKAEVDQVNRNLADFERVKRHALLAAQFSIETGELTPSLKVKRKVVFAKYKEILDTLVRS